MKKKQTITLSYQKFDQYYGKKRLKCDSGHRHFFIMSNGDTSRCGGYYYGINEKYGNFLGNIKDNSLRNRISKNKNNYFQCPEGKCFAQCDGNYTQQTFEDKIIHIGEKIIRKNLYEKDYCIIQIHLTSLCNLKCEYCCAEKWMKKLKSQNLTEKEWVNISSFFINNFEIGHFVIMGGEPTIAKGFESFMMSILLAGWTCEVLTNFSFPEKFYELCKKIPKKYLKNMMIYVSLHPTQKDFNFQRIIKNLKEINKTYEVPFACSLVTSKYNLKWAKKNEIEKKVISSGANWYGLISEI